MQHATLSRWTFALRLTLIASLMSAIVAFAVWPVLAAESEQAVEIKLFSFPKALEVTRGTTVVWTNQDAIEHSVTAGTPATPDEAFDSGYFVQGESFRHHFDEAGEFAYFCTRHESMRGTVKVVEAE